MANDVRFIEANGLRFGYLEWGAGPLVLLVHGFPDTAYTWDVIGPEIAKQGYRVVAPFLRGYWPTAIPSNDTDARTLGEDVLALARVLAPGKVRLVGHDWGAEAVLAATALGPERVERLVTVAIPHRAAIRPSPRLAWAIRHFITLRRRGAEARFAANEYAMIGTLWRRWSPTWKYTSSDLAPVKASFAKAGCLHAALGYYRAATLLPPAFLRAKIPVASLAVAGGDDPGVTPAVFESARSIYTGDYRVATIPGGHFCHRESPDDFLEAVVPFLA